MSGRPHCALFAFQLRGLDGRGRVVLDVLQRDRVLECSADRGVDVAQRLGVQAGRLGLRNVPPLVPATGRTGGVDRRAARLRDCTRTRRFAGGDAGRPELVHGAVVVGPDPPAVPQLDVELKDPRLVQLLQL